MTRRTPSLPCMALIAAGAMWSTACVPTIDSTAAESLGRAAALVDQQSMATFDGGNGLTRRVSIDRFIGSGSVALSEDKFDIVVTPQSAAAWSDTLTTIQRYAALLASLTGGSRGQATASAVDGLTAELDGGAVGAGISPGVGLALASLAHALVEVRAGRDARRIANAVDPAFQATVHAMADAVGADDRTGLRGTVWSAWNASFGGLRRAYVDAASRRREAQQRAIVDRFLVAVDHRDAQLRLLAALRASLLALGTAHAAIALGRRAPLSPLLEAITARVLHARRHSTIEEPVP